MTFEERRRQIIEKAAEVFAVHGVAGTRTKDIAEACGINEGLLYNHFPSKDELYREAMLCSYDEASEGWRELGLGQPNGLLGLMAILRNQLTMLSDNPVLAANMWHGVASATHDPHMKDLIRDRFGRHHQFLVKLVEKGQIDGSIKPGIDPEQAAWFMRGIAWCFILSMLLDQYSGKELGSPEDLCEMFFRVLTAGPQSFVDDRQSSLDHNSG